MRVLLAARPYDLSLQAHDGFVMRRHRLIGQLREVAEVEVLLVRTPGDGATVASTYEDLLLGEVKVEPVEAGLTARLQRSSKNVRHGDTLQDDVKRLLTQTRAERAVTFGPWLDLEYRAIWRMLPTLHMFEEDLRRMPEIASQRFRARAFRAVEDLAVRMSGDLPELVGFISPNEMRSARRRFGRSSCLHLPFVLDPHDWPVAQRVSAGETVLVVGQFAEGRNAEGLAAIMRSCLELPPVLVVSGAGLHPTLRPFEQSGRLRLVSATDNELYDLYRQCRVSVIPAQRATGVKTTILQAWTCGAPVVAFSATARTVGGVDGRDLLVAQSPRHMGQLLKSLFVDDASRASLAQGGRTRMLKDFDPVSSGVAFLEAVRGLGPEAPGAAA